MTSQFPYPYYFYGSADSTDKDVLISIPRSDMPEHQEQRKRFVKKLVDQYQFDWNATLVVIEDGYIRDTIYPKAWIDGLNNAFFRTYHFHEQQFPLPIKGEVPRHYLLSIYKMVRTVLSLLTRTHYRPVVRPIMKGIHAFDLKLAALKEIDLLTIDDFNQKNVRTEDGWKTIAFYLGQNLSLLKDNIEIYTKQELVKEHPALTKFIYRESVEYADMVVLQNKLGEWLKVVKNRGEYISENGILSSGGERVDMRKEIYLVD